MLFLTLAEAGPLPEYARASLGREVSGTVARLVLDGVLEFEHKGEWRHGGAAAALLAPHEPLIGRGRIGALSLTALQYGQQLGIASEDVLVHRLYGFGRRPIGPELRRLMPDTAAVSDAIGLGVAGRVTRALAAAWAELPASKDGRHWRHWRPRAVGRRRPSRANVKLYLSPTVEALGDTLWVLSELLGSAPSATAFKVGVGLGGICRPDKVVVYFDGLDALHATAQDLSVRLRGVPAQGVPFTAAVTEDGLLSWAVDPEGTSWRYWLAGRLAEHLVQGRLESNGPPPWRYALQRLRFDGVDTVGWARADGVVPQASEG
ncbi:hypothetical protein E0H73_39940 [Kribbella pittospori]|uniref:Uncharacterized protein n=1 Tax=Kribbella pittospori TaxID=722689 RepID=A0A4R0K0K9_9ACTN|nr:hypothetical protein [Kribbella pittospori]TCC52114.1 hypothetical protein E0H73_39940 [Kribbella pittospori]